jgi:cytochrome c553
MSRSRVSRGLIPALLVVAAACSKPAPAPEAAQAPAPTPEERGRYLVSTSACHDCHSPKIFTANGPVEDSSRLLSGHPSELKIGPYPGGMLGPNRWGAAASPDFTAWAGPWGISFTANLTPDSTGLANWTPEMFIQALRTGKHAGVGRPILPPMPWPVYAHFTDEDLRAIFAYLKTVKPVHNVVPQPVPPPPPPSGS